MPQGSSESRSGHRWNTVRAVLLVLWLAVVAGLTLTPQSTAHLDPSVPQLSACLICGERGTSDALLNLLLLAPLGLLLADRGWTPLRVAGTAMLLASSIELTQHFIPGRYSNLGDVVTNTTGAWVGAVLWSMRARWLPGQGVDARVLRVLAVLVAPAVAVAFAWLLIPAWPAEPYWGQWTPDLGSIEQYQGAVIDARLDSIPLPSRELPARARVRSALSRDWTMEADVVKGPPPTSLAPVLNIYDGKQREVTMLGAVHQDLVYRERTWAAVLRLDEPARWWPGVLAGTSAGDTVHMEVVRRGSTRCLVFGGSESCPAFTVGRSWALILPLHPVSGRMRGGLDAFWMFVLLIPAGFWSERWRGVVGSGAAVGLLVALAVALTPLVAPPWTEMVGAALGLVVGRGLRAVVVWTGIPRPDGASNA